MSGVALVLEFDGLGQARAAFGALQAAGEDLRPALSDIGQELEASTVDRFETNVAPDGTPWRPSLRAQTKGGVTLVEEGHLRDSVHWRIDGDDTVEIGAGGIAAAYAAAHQVGAVIEAHGPGGLRFQLATGQWIHRQRVTIPARPYLGISAEDETAIGEILVDHYRAALERRLG
jgi:phage virion morphogenesis protein